MKVKVIRPFRDKHTKVVYQKGQEIEVTAERYEELTSAARVLFVEEIGTVSRPAKKPTKKSKK